MCQQFAPYDNTPVGTSTRRILHTCQIDSGAEVMVGDNGGPGDEYEGIFHCFRSAPQSDGTRTQLTFALSMDAAAALVHLYISAGYLTRGMVLTHINTTVMRNGD